jgi:hypothetical protein
MVKDNEPSYLDEDSDHDREIEQLEERLRASGNEVRELRAELDRRTAIVRDLVEQARIDGLDSRTLSSERDNAIARAVEAEAARVEAALRLDEVCGRLAVAGISPEEIHTASEANCAELSGRVRGMKSRIAEIEEARETAEARLVLKEHELIETQEKALSFERQLEEMKERFEIELTRTTLAPSNDKTEELVKENALLRETCDGLLKRSTDAERLLDEARDNTAAIQAATDDIKEENAALRASVEELQRAQAELQLQVAEKEQAFEGERHKSNQVIAEKYQSESKVIDLNNELEGARLKVQLLQDALDSAIDQKSALSNELRAVRSDFDSRISISDERIVQLTDALRESRRALQKLFEIITDKDPDASRSSGTQDLDMEDVDTPRMDGNPPKKTPD